MAEQETNKELISLSDKYLIQPIIVDEGTRKKTIPLLNVVSRQFFIKAKPQRTPNYLCQDDIYTLIVTLPLIDTKAGIGEFSLSELEASYKFVMGVDYINRKDLLENLNNLFDKYTEIEGTMQDNKGAKYWGTDRIRAFSGLGLFDKNKKEIGGGGNKYTKRIRVIVHPLIINNLRGNLDGYQITKIELFSQYRKELNSRQMKLLLLLVAETGGDKTISGGDLSHIYNFAKTGKKALEQDIQELKDKGLLGDKTEVKKYQNKKGYYLYATKGESLSELTQEQPRLALEPPKPKANEPAIDTKELIKGVKKIKEKRNFTLDEIVTKLNSCLDELKTSKTLSEKEASQYKIKDKSVLQRRLSGKRQITNIEGKVIELFIKIY